MNIKDFLIDNYIWIIVIILITIITIIGFLADKKKGEKKKEGIQNPNSNNMAMNNQQQMQYQQPMMGIQEQTNSNMGMNYNNPIPQMQNGFNQNMMSSQNVSPVVTEPTPVAINVMPTNNMNQMNNPMPVENVVPRVEQEPMYQPLSEQKPIIAPQPIPNFSEPANNIPQPVIPNAPQSLSNMGQTPVETSLPQMNVNQPMQFNSEPLMNQVPNYNISNNVSQMGMDNSQMLPNMNQNITIPQPINNTTIPTPQPVMVQPIMNNINNNPQMMGEQSYNQPVQQSHIESTVNQSSQPISFVYGPQNNNQNM